MSYENEELYWQKTPAEMRREISDLKVKLITAVDLIENIIGFYQTLIRSLTGLTEKCVDVESTVKRFIDNTNKELGRQSENQEY